MYVKLITNSLLVSNSSYFGDICVKVDMLVFVIIILWLLIPHGYNYKNVSFHTIVSKLTVCNYPTRLCYK
jgi:hypothetical protein